MACTPLTADSTAHTADTTSITADATEFCTAGAAPFNASQSISFVSVAERPHRKRRKRLDYALLLLS